MMAESLAGTLAAPERDDRLDRARAHLALELYGLPFSNVHIPILLVKSNHI